MNLWVMRGKMMMSIRKDSTTAIIYGRVSTVKQGITGLGIHAQINTAKAKAAELGLEVIEIFKEQESGRKTALQRPQLQAAIEKCKETGAALIVAKMDRLTRNFNFMSYLADASEMKNVQIVACDVPQLSDPAQSKFLWRILAAVAELEAQTTAQRTRAAFAEAKRTLANDGKYRRKSDGKIIRKFGNPDPRKASKAGVLKLKKDTKAFHRKIYPVILEIEEAGISSLRGIAGALDRRGIKTSQAELMDSPGLSSRDETEQPPKWSAEAVRKIKISMGNSIVPQIAQEIGEAIKVTHGY